MGQHERKRGVGRLLHNANGTKYSFANDEVKRSINWVLEMKVPSPCYWKQAKRN